MATPKKGFNIYKVVDDSIAEFYILHDGVQYVVTVDIDDLNRLIELDLHWNVYKRKDLCYAITNNYGRDENGRYKLLNTILLHRFILNDEIQSGMHIDHINHNGLDNRKSNLRIIKVSENATNRSGKNSNNKSGYRNVFWSTKDKRWAVSLHKDGRQIYGGHYTDVHEAGRVAQNLREQYYGEYAGKS